MSKRRDNAISLYMKGIRDGKVREAVTKHTGDRYTQHSTGVKDGIEGFVEFFEPFVQRNPHRDIQIVRAIEDGQYVFLHVYQDINNGEAKWITTDLFDTDSDGKIIEHWDVIAPFSEASLSGHTQIDGPNEISDTHITEENKAIVRGYITDVLQRGQVDKITEFVSSESFVQHDPEVADGIDGLTAHIGELAAKGLAMKYDEIFKIIGQGNFVMSYCKMSLGEKQYAVFDVFRLEKGFIVEQWDNMEEIPPKEEWANKGKF